MRKTSIYLCVKLSGKILILTQKFQILKYTIYKPKNMVSKITTKRKI